MAPLLIPLLKMAPMIMGALGSMQGKEDPKKKRAQQFAPPIDPMSMMSMFGGGGQ